GHEADDHHQHGGEHKQPFAVIEPVHVPKVEHDAIVHGPDGGDARIVLCPGDNAVEEVLFELGHRIGVVAHDEVGSEASKAANHADHEGPHRCGSGGAFPEHAQ